MALCCIGHMRPRHKLGKSPFGAPSPTKFLKIFVEPYKAMRNAMCSRTRVFQRPSLVLHGPLFPSASLHAMFFFSLSQRSYYALARTSVPYDKSEMLFSTERINLPLSVFLSSFGMYPICIGGYAPLYVITCLQL